MERIRNLHEPVAVTPRLQDVLDMDTLIIRDRDRQDKATALFNLARMLDACNVRYVIMGAMAVRLYSRRSRSTVSIDVVCDPARFSSVRVHQTWCEYDFRLSEEKPSRLLLRDDISNVNVFVYLNHALTFLLDEWEYEWIGNQRIIFAAPLPLVVSKLQTQQREWPRDAASRLQDRVHLMHLLTRSPELGDQLRGHPLTNDEMRAVLVQVLAELAPAWKRAAKRRRMAK